MMNANAKKLLFGRSISTFGDNLYQLAVVWYVYAATQNAFYTGLITAMTMLPKALSFLVGPLVDHGNKKKILVSAQLIQALLILLVPLAFYFNRAILPTIFVTILLVSFIENYERTAEFAVIPHIVPEKGLIKYNSLSASISRIVEVAVSAAFSLIIAHISVSQIYLINGLTYLLAFVCFFGVQSAETVKAEKLNFSQYKISFKEGITAFFSSEAVSICLPIMLLNFTMGIVSAILPAYAAALGSIDYFGYIRLAMSIGLILGTTLAMKLTKLSYLFKLRVFPLITCVLWIAAVLINQLYFSLPLLSLAFIPYGVLTITLITQIQSSLPAALLGRIVTIIDSVLVATMPVGAILGGLLAESVPPAYAMIVWGISILTLSVMTLKRPKKA